MNDPTESEDSLLRELAGLRHAVQERTAALDAFPDPLLLHDRDGRVAWANRAACDVTGLSLDTMIGRACSEIFGQDAAACAQCALTLSWKSGQPEESFVQTPQGQLHVIQAIPVRDKAGAVSHVLQIIENAAARLTQRSLRSYAMETAFDGLWIGDIEGYLEDVNDQAARMLGYTREEMRGMHVGRIVATDAPEETCARITALLQNSGGRFETRLRHKDGHTFDVEVTCSHSPFKSDRFVIFIRDITDRKLMERELRDREERLKLALSGGELGTWDWNIPTGEVRFNRRWAEMLGYSFDELRQHVGTWDTLLHPDDKAAAWEAIDAHLTGKTPLFETEYRLRKKDGAWAWVLDKGRVLERDADGKPLRACGTHLDISKRKQMELALQQSEEKFSKTFRHAPLIMAISTVEDGTFVDVNDAFVRAFAYSREEAIGFRSTDLGILTPHDRKRFKEKLSQKETDHRTELPFRRKNGEVLYGQVWGEVFEIQGQSCFLSIVNDITEVKRAERERLASISLLRLLNAEGGLHELIRELTRFLQEWSQCEAVGVRLKEGEDFPYFETRGFDREFVQSENSLCETATSGTLVRGPGGAPVLRCLCGEILRGRLDPAAPFATEGGSFWTNNASALAASAGTANGQTPGSRRCWAAGFQSIALIPLRAGVETLGLLQLNDRRPDRFDAKTIALFERLASHIAGELAQRQTASKLRESEEKFRDLAESLPQVVFEADLAGQLTYTNQHGFKLFGYTRAEFAAGLTVFQMLMPEDRERAARVIEAIMAGGEDTGNEYRARRKDGYSFPVIVYTSPIIRNGKPIGLRGVLVDISERKRSEEQIKLQAMVLDQIQDMVTVTDLDGVITYVNDAEVARMGYSKEDLIGRNVRIYGANTDPDGSQQEIIHQTRRQGHWRGQVVNYGADGREMIVDSRTRLVRDEKGQAVAMCGIATDVTEQRKIENALRASERRLHEILDSISAGVIAVDPGELTIRYVNPAATALIGRPPETILGRPCSEFMRPSGPQDPSVDIARDWGQSRELELVAADGHSIPVLQTVRKAFLGGAECLLKSFIDLTALKHAEKEKQTLEAQLRQSQKMEAVGTLAGGVAHDFNNLLQAILGYTDMAIALLPAEHAARANLEQVNRAGQRAATLTRQLLTFSRREAHEPTVLNLNELIAELNRMMIRIIGEHINLRFDSHSNLRNVQADPGQIEQIILNLCVNAKDAMPDGGTIHISTANAALTADQCAGWPDARPGDFVRLTVRDTGHGMSPEVRERIFEPFFTTKGVGEGTGLGLATVYAIVQRHQGVIRVDSAEGRGTTFTILLPACADATESEKAAELKADVAGGSETILLAEDDDIVREMASDILKQLGYRLLVARNGEEALRLIQERGGEIQFAVLDVIMPKAGGLQVAQAIRKANLPIPILFCTGYGYEDVTPERLPEGCELIEKPYAPARLLQKIREMLK